MATLITEVPLEQFLIHTAVLQVAQMVTSCFRCKQHAALLIKLLHPYCAFPLWYSKGVQMEQENEEIQS